MRVSILFAMLLAVVTTAEAQPLSGDKPNVVSVELLGRAGVYSVNFERYLHPKIGVGAGVAYWGIGDGTLVVVPLYVAANPIGKTHSPYLAAGWTLGVFSDLFGTSRDLSSTGVGTLTAGYQFRSSSGFILRPTVNLFYRVGTSLVWPGVMIGHSF